MTYREERERKREEESVKSLTVVFFVANEDLRYLVDVAGERVVELAGGLALAEADRAQEAAVAVEHLHAWSGQKPSKTSSDQIKINQRSFYKRRFYLRWLRRSTTKMLLMASM